MRARSEKKDSSHAVRIEATPSLGRSEDAYFAHGGASPEVREKKKCFEFGRSEVE